MLTGGTGSDIFAFAPAGGYDVVSDFDLAGDRLQVDLLGITDLSGLTIGASLVGNARIGTGVDGSVELIGVNAGDLGSAHFIFQEIV